MFQITDIRLPAAPKLRSPQRLLNARAIRHERVRHLTYFLFVAGIFALVVIITAGLAHLALAAFTRGIPATLEQARLMGAM